jgi:phosphoribosylformylglycinamidine synthase
VANLRIPGFAQPWETDLPRPPRMASALNIMLEAPIGAAAYNNEFGRPNLAGYFRSFEAIAADGRNRGFHKPIMIAGGYGNIRRQHVEKMKVVEGAQLIVLGGPAMLIGLGGGAASSMATGASSEALDYASVQRANPELERRCQEVVDACWALGEKNPILSVHDVGAGGISNALPELVHADDRGGHFRLRSVLSADPALSPMEIWCNESQERYVLAVRPEGVAVLQGFCARERCPMAVVGTATAERQLIVEDADGSCPVDMPMPVLLGKPPRMRRDTQRAASAAVPFAMPENFEDAARRVLQHPSVASKQFLITIGDRTVGGLTVRDQMVGPWQVPVADCAVTASGFEATTGEAMSMGERPVLALLDAPASGRMAVGEAITNIMSARIGALSDVRLSANWMAACGQGDEDARLFDTVRAVGAELCPALGIAIPVGKDSLSMKSVWSDGEGAHTQIAPLSLIVTAFAPVLDVRASLTPQLRLDAGETALVLIDLGAGKNRLGGSILTQVYSQLGETPPDLDDPATLKAAFELVQRWNGEGRVLACHDRSDGGLLATLCEMAFAGHCGLRAGGLDAAGWFAEELGLVLQVRAGDTQRLLDEAQALGLHALRVGAPSEDDRIVIDGLPGKKKAPLLDEARSTLFKAWFETSYRMARLRDNPDCVDEEFESTGRFSDTGLSVSLSFDPQPRAIPAAMRRPRVAVLREQGVNGQYEMAYAFHAAGFEAVDVHMSDILEGRVSLSTFQGLVACGGFSYGDVLGAGAGMGQDHPVQPARSRRIPDLPRGHVEVRARRLQRLPDVCRIAGAGSGRLALADVPPQSLGAVRGALDDGRSARVEVDPVCRHGRLAHAHRRGARRRPSGIPHRRESRRVEGQRPGRDALHRQPGRSRGALSGESERLAVGTHVDLQRGRPRDDPDAASRAHDPRRHRVVVARCRERRHHAAHAVVPDVRERAELAGVVRANPGAVNHAG